MSLTLRPYQDQALEQVEKHEAEGLRRQLGVAATGLGKTVMFVELARRRPGRTLILAHREELVAQAWAKVREIAPDAKVGVVKADLDETLADVVVASVQTISRPARLGRLLRSEELVGRFDLVVVDEAHHATADTYRTVLKALRAGEADGPLLLGVTATPDRGDGQGLNDLFEGIVFDYGMLWGIRAGFLSELRGLQVVIDSLDMSTVKVTAGDYNQGQAGRAMEAAQTHHYTVAAWLEHAAGRRTLAFTPTVETARLLAEEFNLQGIPFGFVHGGTPADERRQLLHDFETGRLTGVANCGVLTEGYDNPRVDCIIPKPTKSRALYTQMVGRGTRRHPDKLDCLVLDMVGVAAEHSLLTVPSLFGVDVKRRRQMQDGSGALSEVMLDQDEELVRLGKLRAEEIELFRTARASGIAWVAIHDPGELAQYHRPLGFRRINNEQVEILPTVVLAQNRRDPELWNAGLWLHSGEKRGLIGGIGVSMETAQGLAEDYVRRFSRRDPRADAPWRAKKPPEWLVIRAKKWRLPELESYKTGAELSDALERFMARCRKANEDARKAKAAR